MVVFRWQKIENELLKGVRKEGKVSQKAKEERIFRKQPGGFLHYCEKVKRDKDRNCAIRSGDELSAADPGVTQVEG